MEAIQSEQSPTYHRRSNTWLPEQVWTMPVAHSMLGVLHKSWYSDAPACVLVLCGDCTNHVLVVACLSLLWHAIFVEDIQAHKGKVVVLPCCEVAFALKQSLDRLQMRLSS